MYVVCEVNGLKVSGLLGGSWVVISGVISPLIWVISVVTLLISLLITTHEPPSTMLYTPIIIPLFSELVESFRLETRLFLFFELFR